MLENGAAEDQPLPRSIKLFAPWRWLLRMPLWKQYGLTLGTLAVVYVETPVMIAPLLNRRGGVPGPVEQSFSLFWYPIDVIYCSSPTVQLFYDWQFDRMSDFLILIGL